MQLTPSNMPGELQEPTRAVGHSWGRGGLSRAIPDLDRQESSPDWMEHRERGELNLTTAGIFQVKNMRGDKAEDDKFTILSRIVSSRLAWGTIGNGDALP